MKKSRKMWQRTAAFACSLALIAGNSMSVMPALAIAADEITGSEETGADTGNTTGDNNGDNDGNNSDNGNAEPPKPSENDGEGSEQENPAETVSIYGTIKDINGNPQVIFNGLKVTIIDEKTEEEYQCTAGKGNNNQYEYKIENIPKSDAYIIFVESTDFSAEYKRRVSQSEIEGGFDITLEKRYHNFNIRFSPEKNSQNNEYRNIFSIYKYDAQNKKFDDQPMWNLTNLNNDSCDPHKFKIVNSAENLYGVVSVKVGEKEIPLTKEVITTDDSEEVSVEYYDLGIIPDNSEVIIEVTEFIQPDVDITYFDSTDKEMEYDLWKNTWATEKSIHIGTPKGEGNTVIYYYFSSEKLNFSETNVTEKILNDGTIISAGTRKYSKNGYVYIVVKDEAGDSGNISEVKEIEISKIDTTKPLGKVDFIVVENDNVFFSLSGVEDKGTELMLASGVDKIYLLCGEEKIEMKQSGSEYVLDGDSILDIKDINSYSVCIEDKAGNVKTIDLQKTLTLNITYSTDIEKRLTLNAVVSNTTYDETEHQIYIDNEAKSEITISENETYTFEVRLNDEENTSIAKHSVTISNIDNVAPYFSGDGVKTTWDQESWISNTIYPDDLEITVSARDNGIGVKTLRYAKIPIEKIDEDGNLVEGYTPIYYTKTLSKAQQDAEAEFKLQISTTTEFNGIYRFWVQDSFGNETGNYKDVRVKIDNTAPTNASLTYTETEKDPSLIKKVLNAFTFGLFFKSEIKITISGKDARLYQDSGIARIEYQLVPLEPGSDASIIPTLNDEKWKVAAYTEDKTTITISTDEYKEGFSGKVYARIIDNAGNQTVFFTDTANGSFVVLDDKGGTIDVNSYLGSNGTNGEYKGQWTNDDVYIKITGGETLSGLGCYEYYIEYADQSKNSSEPKWIQLDDGTSYVNYLKVSSDTNATYHFRAVSNLGVRGDEKTVIVKVQKTIPKDADTVIPEPNGTNSWNTTIPDIGIIKPTVNKYAAPVHTYYKLWNTQVGETEPSDGIEFDGHNKPEIHNDGIYQLKVWTVDEAGNHCDTESENEIETIKVDSTAPIYKDLTLETTDVDGAVDIFARDQNSVIYRHIHPNAVTIKSHFDCEISGLYTLEYQKVSSFNVNDANWTKFDGNTGLIVEPNEKFILAVRATDNAGNQTVVYSDGIIIDSEAPVGEGVAPEITISPASPNANGLHNSDVNVAISVYDPPYSGGSYDADNGIYSGLSKVTCRIVTDGQITSEVVLYDANENPSDLDLQQSLNQTITVNSQQNNSNNVYVEVEAVDRAGNTRISRTAEGEIKIDITAPNINISYDNNSANGEYFKDNRTATISVTERNFDPNDVKFTLANTDGAVPSISAWTTSGGSGNGDNTVHTATLTYSSDGDYTFDIAYTDLADNPCTDISYAVGTLAAQKFTIDKTVPTVDVSYDNNSVTNGKYFNAGRTATIVINEHNFDESGVKITATASLNGTNITVPSANITWTDNGNLRTAVIKYDKDGDYTFDISFTDMAGNVCELPSYGTSEAGKDFVIDTEIEDPIIKVNGVDGNGKAYKDGVVLSLSFGDINYDSYDVKLARTRMGEKDVDVTKQFIDNIKVNGNGGEGSFDTFEKIQENDGIYTLSVTFKDKAGNEATEEVKFTVNRYGSVYEYSDYLMSLISDGGAYVQSLENDIVITEYNADRLIEGSLSLVLTRDGKPVEDIIYEITPEINNTVAIGESGWYQYRYTISKENFASDGIYKLVVSSKDATGNTPENTNYEDQAILFRIDSTPPELTSISGLEKRYINAQKLTVGYDVFDTIGLKSITVYVDGEEVAKITDFSSDMNNYSGLFELSESKNDQHIRLVVEDMAGNVTDTDDGDFKSAYSFNKTVTLSTNPFVRWYANRPLFFGTLGGGAGIIALVAGLLVFLKKRKKGSNF